MDWLDELEERGRLTGKITDRVLKAHGARGKRAIDAVSENRVKEYLDFIVVVGKHDEYIIEGESCTCDDFQYNLDDDELCWHIIAAKIAEATDQMDEHDMWYSEVRDLV
ncbi:MAG: SWIM zinc finger family protein [Halobacteria archaeon]|nr:SWIM zinc finger family protein [Halobacteria archaeon]